MLSLFAHVGVVVLFASGRIVVGLACVSCGVAVVVLLSWCCFLVHVTCVVFVSSLVLLVSSLLVCLLLCGKQGIGQGLCRSSKRLLVSSVVLLLLPVSLLVSS